MRARLSRLIAGIFGISRPGDKRKKLLSRLEQSLGYDFQNLKLLETALSHLSFINENGRKDTESNERLEFLGDAVLDLAVSEYLYNRFLAAREGELTRIKSSIVSRSALVRQAAQINLEDYILYARESFTEGKRGKETIIANTLEAIIGAIYLDGGLEAAKKFIYLKMLGGGKAKLGYDSLHESKNMLLHLSQVNYHCQPSYKIVEVTGPEHAKKFVCEVTVAGNLLGRGVGANKKEAEKKAAQEALQFLEQMDSPDKTVS